MNLKDTFRYLIGSYYGICEMDEYDLKEYTLKDLEQYIKEFISQNPIDDLNLYDEALIIKDKMPLQTKLQDALLVLPKINASTELILLVKSRLRALKEEEQYERIHNCWN